MSLIRPLHIGMHKFPVNLVQGPLAGVSCAPFRRLSSRYGKPAFNYTEMISCKTILNQQQSHQRLLEIDNNEGAVCFQLSATDPKDLVRATQIVTGYGASLIDLNCGCPVNKIRSKGAGSSLLAFPDKLYQLICAMKQNTHLPVSIKIRVDGDSNDQYNQALVQVVNESGVDFLTVHGRHWTDTYESACYYDQIRMFVENVKVPVIGNGDVACVDSLRAMLNTGCAGVMIARAGVGQPWLVEKLIAEMQGMLYQPPSQIAIAQIFIEHVHALSKLLNSDKFAVIQARKLAKYYARTIYNKAEFCDHVNRCESLDAFKTLCFRYFT